MRAHGALPAQRPAPNRRTSSARQAGQVARSRSTAEPGYALAGPRRLRPARDQEGPARRRGRADCRAERGSACVLRIAPTDAEIQISAADAALPVLREYLAAFRRRSERRA